MKLLSTTPRKCIKKWRNSRNILDFGTRWRLVVSFTPRPLYFRGNSPLYSWDKKLGRLQNTVEKRKLIVSARNRTPVHLALITAICPPYTMPLRKYFCVLHTAGLGLRPSQDSFQTPCMSSPPLTMTSISALTWNSCSPKFPYLTLLISTWPHTASEGLSTWMEH
jgi:hypothetical protein